MKHRFKSQYSSPGKKRVAGIALSLLAAILAVTTFFNNQVVDVHRHDTYYVLSAGQLQVPFALLFGVEAWIYHLLRNRSRAAWMKTVHVITCWIFILFIFWIPVHSSSSLGNVPRRYYDYSPGPFGALKDAGITGILILMFLLGQLLFIAHGAINLLRKQCATALTSRLK